MKRNHFLWACFLWCSLGATAQIRTLKSEASPTSFFGKEYASEAVKPSPFLENLKFDLNLPDLSQARLNSNGKELRKSLHLNYYDIIDHMKRQPIEKMIYPNINYLGGHMVDRNRRNFIPDPNSF